jgi:hypothetical protein
MFMSDPLPLLFCCLAAVNALRYATAVSAKKGYVMSHPLILFSTFSFCQWEYGRDSIVGIATRYGLDVLGIESRWGRDFPHPDRPWGPPSLLYNEYQVSFPGVKWPGHGVDHPPLSSARVKERVELYLCSPSGPSWPVQGRTLLLPFNGNMFL